MVEYSIASIPEIFRDCASEFSPKDVKYANCTIPNGASSCKMLKELHDAKDFRKYFLATVPLVFSAFAIVLNIIFCLMTVIFWRKNKLSSKQRYAFLLSRTVSTIIALILFYIVIIAWKTGGFQYTSATIFILIASLTFLTHSGTYLGMTTILYLAIVHPIQHRYLVTMRRCSAAILIIWLVSVGFSLCVGLLGATLFYPETAPIRCSFSSCQRPFAIVVVCLLTVFFVTVIMFYSVMLFRMHRRKLKAQAARRTPSDASSSSTNVRTMNRLAFNMVTFAIGALPIVVVTIIAAANLESLASLGLGNKSPCKTFENGKLFWQVEVLASVAAIVWVLTMIADPIINSYVDRHYRASIRDSCRQVFACIKHRGHTDQ